MAMIEVTFPHPRAAVFGVLTDPMSYPDWLVGAQAIRGIEPGWPSPGASFHHRVGLGGPVSVADSTTVRAIEAPALLELEVRARPFGRGVSRFELVAEGPSTTVVRFEEHAIGAAALANPVAGPLIRRRNQRSMARLASLLDDRAS